MRQYGTNGPLFPWYESPVARLLIAGSIAAVVIAAGLLYYQAWRQSNCDREAASVSGRLSASLERFCHQMQDSHCTSLWKEVSEDHLRFLVGPYYGWRGTSPYSRCGILVRMKNGELHACAMRGTHPTDNGKDRLVHRMQKMACEEQSHDPLKELPTIVGPCTGKAYGLSSPGANRYAPLYAETIIDEKTCQFLRPRNLPELGAYY